MPPFKYNARIAGIENCPPDDYAERQIRAFRVVRTDPPADDSFLPVSIQGPVRKLSEKPLCSGFGLSLFTDVDSVKQKMARLKRSHPHIEEALGSKIAEGVVAPGDGVCSEPNTQGHFTLHEYEGCNLAAKFVVVAQGLE